MTWNGLESDFVGKRAGGMDELEGRNLYMGASPC